MEDPITADFPSRNELEEEEEFARKLTDQYTITPEIQYQGASSPQTLLFLIGRGPSLLTTAIFPTITPSGYINIPELQRLRSPLEEEYGAVQSHINKSLIGSVNEGSLVVVECPKELPAEQATTWASAAIDLLKPKSVLVACTLLASRYVGPGSPSDEDIIYSLQTNTDVSKNNQSTVRQLPVGNMIDGLPAAIIQQCYVHDVPAAAVIEVENSPVPDALRLSHLAEALSKELSRLMNSGGDEGELNVTKEVKEKIAAAVNAVYQSSASNSMFI